MNARTALLALTLGFASLAACSSSDTTTATGTSSTGSETTTSATTSTGTGGAGGAGASTTGAGGGTSASSTATSSASATSSGAGGMAAFALTSAGITEGMAIPIKYVCKPVGANGSPDLSWTAGPAGTLSYAVVLSDKTFNDYLHWVIWDIPAGTTALPPGVEKKANPAVPAGSKQVKSYDGQTFGYLGPCPPNTHTYEFAVFALDVATLPNITTASTLAQARKQIFLHDLASATLTGTYTP